MLSDLLFGMKTVSCHDAFCFLVIDFIAETFGDKHFGHSLASYAEALTFLDGAD